MAKAAPSPLHIEWSPGWIRALDVATGKTAQGETFADIANVTNGHRQAFVAISRANVFLKTTRLPRAASDDLRRILSVQMDQIFPLPASQLSFDFIQTNDLTADGLATIIAAIRADDLRRLRLELKQAGITPTKIFPSSLASASVAARAGFVDALVIESDRNGIALDVVQAGITRFSRVAPSGSDPATEAVRTIAAAKVTDPTVIAVGEVNVPGAVDSLDSTLSLFNLAPPFNFELAEDRILEAKRRVSQRTRLAVLMLLASLLLVATVWADRQDSDAAFKKVQGANARQVTKLSSIASLESSNASKLGAVQTALHRAFAPAQPLSDIAGVVADSLPAGAWLTGMMVERGKALEVRGASKSAADVGHFVDALSASPRFRDVKLVFANSALIGKVPVVQFNVTATCVGNLPMPVPDKKTAAKLAAASTTGGAQ
jgi:Tfp pilus assembly protein PilN